MTQVLIDFNRKYSSAEFERLELPGDCRYELIEGKLVRPPSAGDEHNTIAGELFSVMRTYVKANNLGKVWYETDFVFDKDNTREPDISFVSASRIPPVSRGSVKVVPDLTIEVWSGSDLNTKKEREAARAKIQLYQDCGVRLVWAINPRTQQVLVFRPDTTDHPLVLGLGDELDGEAILPGFKMPVRDLFDYN